MKNFILVLVALFLGLPALTSAQNTSPVGVFTTIESCEASSANYTPAFLSGHKPLTIGEVLVTLPQRQCGEMLIAGGRVAVVGQAAGTQMVVGPDGRIVRRWDCGNRVQGFIIPTLVPATPLVATPIVPTTQSATPTTAGNVATATASVILLPNNWRPQEDLMTFTGFEAYQVQKRGWFCSRHTVGCMIGAGVLTGLGVWLLMRDNNKEGPPAVNTNYGKPICTGVGCP